jgi:hypothetical protein
MDVEHPAGIALHETSRQHAHEPGERHQVRAMAIYFGSKRGLESGAVLELAVVDCHAVNAARPCQGEPRRLRNVADHRLDRRVERRIE